MNEKWTMVGELHPLNDMGMTMDALHLSWMKINIHQ
jgi:hypothetical protein